MYFIQYHSVMIAEDKSEKLRKYFLDKRENISVAESVTSGLLQWQLSNLTDAQKFYQGGISVYNLGQKSRHLHVEPIHAMECNCVSGKVAEEMAVNVCTMFNSNWGIAITGYATPVPESGNKLFCHYCIVQNGAIRATGKIDSEKMPPAQVQEYYVAEVIDQLLKCIAGNQ